MAWTNDDDFMFLNEDEVDEVEDIPKEQGIRGKYGLMEEDRKFVARTSGGYRDPLFPRMRNSKNQRFIKISGPVSLSREKETLKLAIQRPTFAIIPGGWDASEAQNFSE